MASIVAVDVKATDRLHLIAVLVALTAALIARAFLQVEMREAGLNPRFAADLSYLVVPAILAVLLFPVFRSHQEQIRDQFCLANVDGSQVIRAIALGALLRLAWWCHLAAAIALGIYYDGTLLPVSAPAFAFRCPPGHMLATGVLVMAILVPVIEEIIHRGFVQSYLHLFGPLRAIVGSAVVFTVFHPVDSWVFVFIAGLVFGTQFWITRSLWPSIISHATINATIQLDWRCLRGQWNPAVDELPVMPVAVIALVLLVACGGIILALLAQMHRGDKSPR